MKMEEKEVVKPKDRCHKYDNKSLIPQFLYH